MNGIVFNHFIIPPLHSLNSKTQNATHCFLPLFLFTVSAQFSVCFVLVVAVCLTDGCDGQHIKNS